jgi:hypothetical protein
MEQRSNIRALRTTSPIAPPVTLIPVEATGRNRARPIGVFAVGPDGVRFHPAVDVRTLTLATAAVVTAVAAAGAGVAWRRSRPIVGGVTMGPGGWVSFKGVASPPLHRVKGCRPWWARLLRARRLVVEA